MVTRRRTDDNYTHDTGCDGGDGSGGGGEISHGDESEQDGRPSSSTIHASNGMFHVPIIQEEEGKDAEDHERMMIHRKNATTTSFDLTRLIPAVLAVIGVGIVELNGSAGPPTMGDLLSFAQPIRFGIGYFQLESIMCKDPDAALPVSFMKLFVVALASMGLYELTPILHSTDGSSSFIDAITNFHVTLPDLTPVLRSPVALAGVLYTGLITTALALWVESIAFKRVPATDASIILTTEPLFAAAIGAFLLGETFGMSDYVGASIIIGACAMSVLLDASSEEEGGGGDGGDEDESNRKLVFGSVNGDGTGTRL
eukprot:CAMPEP_0184859004 /NCGR_PEP_ID=MMETSP0580-20130426/4027_1 /TAXON_ID=1118495 /ORGANISM="Dactyliosolen fragilissimus" /LENGTH=312 /DNA_ID=CAMNT_0027355405 /DNA_START=322 /DNA_END=1260 /DNA_ORIENTATION=-